MPLPPRVIPGQFEIGERASAWLASEIDAWVASRIASGQGGGMSEIEQYLYSLGRPVVSLGDLAKALQISSVTLR